MKNLQELDTSKLINGVIRYITLVVLLVVVLVVLSISLAKAEHQKKQQKAYTQQIDRNIHYVVENLLKTYTYRVKGLINTTDVADYVKFHNKKALYKLFYPKFKILQEEMPYLKVMQIHLANGESLIRLHKPKMYGDNIASSRPMLQEIHKNHKLLSGYEVGLYANVYRIIGPIFDKNGTYLGALELGLDPNYLLQAIKEMNGDKGLIFISEKQKHPHAKSGESIIEGYRLENKLDATDKKLFEALKSEDILSKNRLINFEGEKYFTHLITLKDFSHKESLKILFFQKFIDSRPFLGPYQLPIYLGILLLLLFAMKLIKSRIKAYQREVTHLYLEKVQIIQKDEKSLEKSQKYHKALFETMPTILIVTNGELIEDANSNMLSFFSCSNLDAFKKKHSCICDFFIEDIGYLHKKMEGVNWLEYIRANPSLTHKVSMLNSNAEKCYFVVFMQELTDENQQRALISFTDVTAYETLNKRFDLAMSGTQDGLWDWNLVTNEIYLSPRWKTMLGYRDEELQNDVQTWRDLVHPDDLEPTMKAVLKNQNKETLSYSGTHRLKHKNGYWVWVLDRGKTLFDTDNQATRMVGFHTDISEIKELELELQNSKRQFDMFMNNVPYIVVIKDELNNIIYENNILKEYRDNRDMVKYAEVTLHDALENFTQSARENGLAEDVFEYKHSSQKYIFRALAFSIPQENGDIYVGIIYINITEQKLMALKLQEQHEVMIAQSRHAAMGEMISMIAHQWRQPLGVIAMEVNNILADIALETLEVESLESGLNGISEQTTHLSQTIDDFRNFFKPEKVKDFVCVEDVFERAFKVLSKSFQENSIVVENHFELVPKVKIFERELQQVIINLLKNAKEAVQTNAKEKKIINKIFETPKSVIVEICDNGGGILQENLEKVFDPYFSTKDEKNGTGLGLYMSQTIVDKHLSGKLSVKNVDGGACFSISIPKDKLQKKSDL